MKIDLHMHSTASDGKLSPTELVDLAVEKNLSVIAISDHDVVDGSRLAIEYAKDKDVEVISGVEFSCEDREAGMYEIHIVGLFVDLEDEALNKLSEDLIRARRIQKEGIIRKLNDLGYEISFEELRAEIVGENFGRPHIANILMKKYREFGNMKDVFDRLLAFGAPAFVTQWKESTGNVIDIIHGAGGVAVLAHPDLYNVRFDREAEEIMDRFIELGGDGVEVDYCYRNGGYGEEEERAAVERVRRLAEEKGLLVSGGGDFHRDGNRCEIGDYGVSDEEFGKLKGGVGS